MNRISLFFDPKSVVLFGATERPGSVGQTTMENLLSSKDKRKIYIVSPNHDKIMDTKCYPNLSALPEAPELAVIATGADTVPDIVEECGKVGIRAVIVISAGFKEAGEKGKEREAKIIEYARKYGMRIMGPNCLGAIRPSSGLNATFARKVTKPGKIAFLSQSGALGTSVLDWAVSRDIGFSAFVSLGSMLDIDFGDLIDFFGEDPQTKSIIIYLESLGNSLRNARKFMSAVRGFARNKPIIVIKPGKFQESMQAAKSHTGAMVGEDSYYDAVFDRAGVVRVEEIGDLFNCASILDTAILPKGQNLAIITNAGGPAVLATDALIGRGGKLAPLSKATMDSLNQVLPAYWSKSNPVDILGDASVERYISAIDIALKDPAVHGIVIIYTPQGVANAVDLAKAISKIAKKSIKPILTAMMGSKEVEKARQVFYDHKVPTYEFPEEAIRTYLYMYHYARNLENLYEAPDDVPLDVGIPKNHLKLLIRNAARAGKLVLSEDDSKKFLNTYRINVTFPHFAGDANAAVIAASSVGYPVVMKIQSPDISHKSDVGGVQLDLKSPDAVRKAFQEMMDEVKQHNPKAHIDGVTVQQMVIDYSYELIMGSKKDQTLGPVIIFGQGGTEAEFYKDIAIGLPPLNQRLARMLIERTNVYGMLSKGFRKKPPANLRLLDEALIRLSNMIADFPEIKELDINPLVVNGDKVIALDARIVIDEDVVKNGASEFSHLIISPYPTRYIQPWLCRDGRNVLLRPIRPEDEPMEHELIAGLSPESSRFRFFYIIKDISHDMLSRFCNIDYSREIAIIAEYGSGGKRRNAGVGRLIIQPDGETAEFATLVADDFQAVGLGHKLTDMLIGIAQEKGLKTMYGIILRDNARMIGLARSLGFKIEQIDPDEYKATLEL
ncbi:MAG: GNAT family N-acetyltransferase [Dehalococcoidales bacterium]|nr:GNAT family N-acetyltransferase [Dehalococcoidales bacterium]